jgi:nitrogen fixation protein NifB
MAVKDISQLHPCFGRQPNRGRLHLPVCPVCNIECRFCRRQLGGEDERPGVAAAVIEAEEAPRYVARALEICPQITVTGIAGPGEALCGDYALKAFRLVGRRFPGLIKCLSTNGLLLAERLDEIAAAGVDALTVTVNAVDPAIQAQICRAVSYRGRRREGQDGAHLLIERQLAGIAAAAAAGIRVKVNTVLIGGLNSFHVGQIAKAAAQAGATLYNIIPLIPQGEFANWPAPDCEQLQAARALAEPHIEIFRHCRHCRADAAGVPGGLDVSRQVYGERAAAETFSHG